MKKKIHESFGTLNIKEPSLKQTSWYSWEIIGCSDHRVPLRCTIFRQKVQIIVVCIWKNDDRTEFTPLEIPLWTKHNSSCRCVTGFRLDLDPDPDMYLDPLRILKCLNNAVLAKKSHLQQKCRNPAKNKSETSWVKNLQNIQTAQILKECRQDLGLSLLWNTSNNLQD